MPEQWIIDSTAEDGHRIVALRHLNPAITGQIDIGPTTTTTSQAAAL